MRQLYRFNKPMKIRSISLPDELDQQVIRAAGKQPYSAFVRDLLADSLTRVEALQAISDQALEEYHANAARRRPENATAIISDASSEGHRRLDALNKIAKGTR
jgi:hypothetical protein